MAISRYVRFRGGPTPPTTPAENPNPGIEVLQHLEAELPRLGVAVFAPEDVEYAHRIMCSVNGKNYEVMVGYDWVAGDWWEVFYARRLSWLKRILGQSEDAETRVLTHALAEALRRLPRIAETRWYKCYGAPVDASHSVTPELQ